jgi:hypothetical protein
MLPFSFSARCPFADSARESPVGDPHHLDSVSGTAINLGRGAGSAANSTSSKISSLAREARAVQPGHTKDSTVTLPSHNISGKPFDQCKRFFSIKYLHNISWLIVAYNSG